MSLSQNADNSTPNNQPASDPTSDASQDNNTIDTPSSDSSSENEDHRPKGDRRGFPFFIIIIAVAILAALSLLPWAQWTDGKFKGFSLISDLIYSNDDQQSGAEVVDPELIAALNENEDQLAPRINSGDSTYTTIPTPDQVKPAQAPRPSGDQVVIEDYTIKSQGLYNFKRAIANRANRPARVAVIGDSYIEGDIFTMDLRADLQDLYGGSGVGYVYMSSPLTGFRTSVPQRCSGWTEHDIRKNMPDKYKALQGEYFTASGAATTTYNGTDKLPHLKSWNNTGFMFIAPSDAKIAITTDAGTKTYDVKASPDVQFIEIPGATSLAKIATSTNGLIALGTYLNDNSGVVVDCMSLRGNSGISHRSLSIDLAGQMRKFIDYDLIIIEYGINALSSSQKDYSGYKKLMVKTVTRIKECFPNADILILGIGDRGQKSGGVVKSIATSPNMVSAQRDIARETGSLFWDTREAMGGDGAVVKWRNEGKINPDYIHLNAKGGKELGALLAGAIKNALNK